MRGLIAAEKYYGTRNKKIAIALSVITILLIGVIVFPGTLSAPRNARIKKEIERLMNAFNTSYQKKDAEGIMALYARDPDIVMLGAGKGEHFIGSTAIQEAYQREFSEFTEITSFEQKILSLHISGGMATLAAERSLAGFKGGEDVSIAGGFSAVLKEDNGSWIFVQTHFSLPHEQSELH